MLLIHLLSIFATVLSTPLRFEGLGLLQSGYNIMTGCPKAPGLDPGFSDRIFDFSSETVRMFDGVEYYFPDALSQVYNSPDCEFKSKSLVLNASVEILVDFKGSIELVGSIKLWKLLKGALTGSLSFHGYLDSILNASLTLTEGFGSCGVYHPQLWAPDLIPFNFSYPFVMSVQSIVKDPSIANIIRFLDAFGTHYLEEVDMGSRYSLVSYFTDVQWKTFAKLVGKGSISAYVNALFHVASAGVKGSTALEIKYAKTMEKFQSKIFESYVGCDLSQLNHTISDWIACSAKNSYAVANYKLRPIVDLLNSVNFPNLKGLEKAVAVLKSASVWPQYCQHVPLCEPSLTLPD